jgi:hypothetical protein
MALTLLTLKESAFVLRRLAGQIAIFTDEPSVTNGTLTIRAPMNDLTLWHNTEQRLD